MNLFRQTWDGKLDRQYLRICSVYRLLDQRRIEKPRAIELLDQRRVTKPERLVELWLGGPLSERGRLNRESWRQPMGDRS